MDQIAECEKQNRQIKDEYRTALIANLQLDVQIDNLEDQLEEVRYVDFEECIAKETLEALRDFKDTKEYDCKFVTAALRYIYRDNIEVLQKKTATNWSKNEAKTPISPEKRHLVEQLFAQRMQYASEHEVTAERKKFLNKHIKSAIETINKGYMEK